MTERAPVRIAMWSGPRNLSTAMMRAWENRPDTVVVDEPLYAYYLAATGIDHPGRDEVLASQPTDWRTVVRALTTAPLPDGATISYQKHMTHHVLPEVDLGALAPLTHAFLIRDPRRVLASLRQGARPTRPLADLGLQQQVGAAPAVRRAGGRLRRPAPRPGGHAARGSARRSACRSTPRCCPGRPGRATPTASGRRTGTRASRPRPASAPAASDAVPDLPDHLAASPSECRPYYDELAAQAVRI